MEFQSTTKKGSRRRCASGDVCGVKFGEMKGKAEDAGTKKVKGRGQARTPHGLVANGTSRDGKSGQPEITGIAATARFARVSQHHLQTFPFTRGGRIGCMAAGTCSLDLWKWS